MYCKKCDRTGNQFRVQTCLNYTKDVVGFNEILRNNEPIQAIHHAVCRKKVKQMFPQKPRYMEKMSTSRTLISLFDAFLLVTLKGKHPGAFNK